MFFIKKMNNFGVLNQANKLVEKFTTIRLNFCKIELFHRI